MLSKAIHFSGGSDRGRTPGRTKTTDTRPRSQQIRSRSEDSGLTTFSQLDDFTPRNSREYKCAPDDASPTLKKVDREGYKNSNQWLSDESIYPGSGPVFRQPHTRNTTRRMAEFHLWSVRSAKRLLNPTAAEKEQALDIEAESERFLEKRNKNFGILWKKIFKK